jgi:hypothetical protein
MVVSIFFDVILAGYNFNGMRNEVEGTAGGHGVLQACQASNNTVPCQHIDREIKPWIVTPLFRHFGA